MEMLHLKTKKAEISWYILFKKKSDIAQNVYFPISHQKVNDNSS